jgi:hypothetical protein
MSKKKLARIIVVCILAIIIIAVITILSPPPEPMLVTHNCTDHTTTSLKAQGEITDDGAATITRRGFYYDADPLYYGLEFDGIDDQVVLPAGSRPTGAFTLAIWCKPTDWDHADAPQLFGGRSLRGYADGLSGITITRYTDKLFFDVADEANAARRTIAPLITKIAPTGEWSFIVLTNSGVAEAGGLKLWRNSAQPIGNTTGAETVRWLDNWVRLGCGYGYNYYKGVVSEVCIYDRELSEAEIKALYNGQDVTGNLRGYWKLDEGSGNTAYDSSGNDNHGSIQGPEWVLADWDLTGEGDIVYETGKFGTGTYSLNITGLEPDTWYRIRAFAENELGIGYGNVVSCKTLE